MTEPSPGAPPGPRPSPLPHLAAECSPDGMLITDGLGTITWANSAAHQLLGHPDGGLHGVNVFELLDDDEQHLALQAVTLIGAAPDKVQPAIYHPRHLDGGRRPVEINGTALTDAEGSPGLMLVTRRADHHALLTGGVSRLSAGEDLDLIVGDVLDDLTHHWGGYYAAFVIYDDGEPQLIGDLPASLAELLNRPSDHDGLPWETAFAEDQIVSQLTDELGEPARSVLRRLDVVGVLAVPVPDPDGPRGVMVLAATTDAPFFLRTFWKQSPTFLLLRFALARRYWVSKLEHAASCDPLTGLANRATFFGALEQRVASADPGLAVLYADLDEFKPVNDRCGHAVGDAVLRVAADRLKATVRPGDLVARIGGDELAILCPVDDERAAITIADRLLAAIDEPIHVAGQTLRLSMSIGVALGGATGETVDQIVERADRALYQAKRRGKGRFVVAAQPDNVS